MHQTLHCERFSITRQVDIDPFVFVDVFLHVTVKPVEVLLLDPRSPLQRLTQGLRERWRGERVDGGQPFPGRSLTPEFQWSAHEGHLIVEWFDSMAARTESLHRQSEGLPLKKQYAFDVMATHNGKAFALQGCFVLDKAIPLARHHPQQAQFWGSLLHVDLALGATPWVKNSQQTDEDIYDEC